MEAPLSNDQPQKVIEPAVQYGTLLPEDTVPGQPETRQRPPESPQPTERRSTRTDACN